MSVQLAAEIWSLVRESIPYDDREQIADSLVGILIDNDFDINDIKHEFAGDPEIKQAIKYYIDDTEVEDEYEEDYSDDNEDENW